jgi:large subunit ribosomal protein L10
VDRSQKEKMVADLSQVFADSNLVVVAHQKGLTVVEMTELRNKMREAGAKFKVTKNRLVRRALDGSQYQNLSDLFVGPTAIAYSEDSVAAAKVAVNFAKDNEKLEILGGNLNDKELGIDGIKALASLPSLDECRAKIVGILSTPATRMAGVLQAPAGQMARVIGAYAAKGDAA